MGGGKSGVQGVQIKGRKDRGERQERLDVVLHNGQ